MSSGGHPSSPGAYSSRPEAPLLGEVTLLSVIRQLPDCRFGGIRNARGVRNRAPRVSLPGWRWIVPEVQQTSRTNGETDDQTVRPHAYLLVWNPEHFQWEDLDDQIRTVRETGKAQQRWSCGRVKNIP